MGDFVHTTINIKPKFIQMHLKYDIYKEKPLELPHNHLQTNIHL